MTQQTAAVSGGRDTLDRAAAWLGSLAGWRRWAVSFFLGCVATLAMPPVGLLPVLYVCFPALVWMLAGCGRRREAFGVGWAFAFGYFLIGLYWINNAFLVFAGQYWFMVPLVGFGFPAALGVFGGAATLIAAAVPGTLARSLALAAAWAAMEWLRGNILTGFPWNLIGHGWVFSDAMIQSAAWIGLYGTSLAALVSCALPAGLHGASRRKRLGLVAASLAIPALAFGAGALRLAAADAADTGIGLRVVQANVPQKEKWVRQLRERNFKRHLDLSALDRPDWVRVVIWPETATPFFFEESPAAQSLAAEMLPEGGVLITGTPRRRTRPVTLWNGMVALDKSGAVLATYDKFHLVPLGEYVPFSDVLPLPAIAASGIDYTPGPGPRTLSLAGVPPFSPLICYEVIFPGAVADPDDPPQWLLNLTNDAWYGSSAGPYQHLAMARLRALEEGVPMVRAANTGISAVIDAYGPVVETVPLNAEGVIDARLPAPTPGVTAYRRVGDVPFFMAVFALALAVAARSRRAPGTAA